MKKQFYLRNLYVLLLIVFLFGCEQKWDHYYSQGGEFSMDTPETAMEVTKFADMEIGPVTVYSSSYTGSEDNFAYAVNYYELSDIVLKQDDETVLALAAKSFMGFSGRNVNVLKKKDIVEQGIKGIELELESRGGSRFVKGKIFYARKKIYYVVIEKIGDKKVSEDDLKFYNSFKFHFKD